MESPDSVVVTGCGSAIDFEQLAGCSGGGISTEQPCRIGEPSLVSSRRRVAGTTDAGSSLLVEHVGHDCRSTSSGAFMATCRLKILPAERSVSRPARIYDRRLRRTGCRHGLQRWGVGGAFASQTSMRCSRISIGSNAPVADAGLNKLLPHGACSNSILPCAVFDDGVTGLDAGCPDGARTLYLVEEPRPSHEEPLRERARGVFRC